MKAQTVLIVEDDLDSASIIEAYLRRDGFLVLIAHDGARALDIFMQRKPDIVLLDIMLPALSGTEVLSFIRKNGDTPVIMVTAVGDEPEKLGALRYGADDYIVKPYNPKEVIARVHAVLRRSSRDQKTSNEFSYGKLKINTDAVSAWVDGDDGQPVSLNLTPAEFNILLTLLKTPFKAFTRLELLETCAPESGALERIVDAHIHNIRRKLQQQGITGVLITVRSVGYRFV